MLDEIISRVNSSENIAILPHVSADGDSIGSSTALGLALIKMGKKASIYLEENVTFTLSFIPGQHLIQVYDGTSSTHDLVIALDTGDLNRLGSRADIFNRCPNTVNIDHHQTNDKFAGINFVDIGAAAVSEIIYRLIKMTDIIMDKDIATCLYVALVTDTGGFRYSNTTSFTHEMAGDLINKGVDVAYVSQQIFESVSLEKTRLNGKAIETLEILEDGKLSIITVTDQMLKESGAKEEDCDNLVNIGRSIIGVEVAVVLKPKDEEYVKANLRSKEYVDVSAIALKFSGGGHKRAAGFTAKGNMEDIKNELVTEIRRALMV